jgi:hypothetical protein
MTLPEFENQLKELSPNFTVKEHPTNDDVAGVYWDGYFVLTIPSKNIYEETRNSYTDKYGRVHRNAVDALNISKVFTERIKDEAYLKYIKGEE